MNKLTKLKKKIKPYLKPKMLIVFGGVWLVSSGWTWIFIAIGAYFKIGWMWKLGSTALGILFLPFCPEKLITVPFSIWLYKKLFKEEINIKEKGEKNERL